MTKFTPWTATSEPKCLLMFSSTSCLDDVSINDSLQVIILFWHKNWKEPFWYMNQQASCKIQV